MSLPEIDISKELVRIKNLGFIKTKRMGNTGVGHTLENNLGIKENNEGEPDFTLNGEPVELKAQREQTSSNITLFTLEPPRKTKGKFKDINLLKQYGYLDEDGRKNLYITMKLNEFNAQGFGLAIDKDNLKIVHNVQGVIWIYPLTYLLSKVRLKLSHKVLLVTAKCKIIEGKEFFLYDNANLFWGISDKGFLELIKQGDLVVEFRMHIKGNGTTARNHGTPFRLNSRNMDKLFSNKRKIL